ncbi:MAG: tRNA (adenosine(37)-N6)-threonylcarbamoyltransferase complex ATPase subunit type 1 TsaE [Nocardioidaceae bacterium]|nr:tRNA (adenosine(37)-N6)-threonylcarbamoyltransferase complex ATPase subunit type 1 TsaE [Nocardioidaceae bacterium]
MSDLRVEEATAADAAAIHEIVQSAFEARGSVDPPTSAHDETVASVAATIQRDGGLLCRLGGVPAGAVLFSGQGVTLGLRRLGVAPRFQSQGVASALVVAAEGWAAARGRDDVRVQARSGLPVAVTFWLDRGYVELSRDDTYLTMGKALPIELVAASADDARAVGARIASLTRAGDVVLLSGELGAGKTTLTQGIGRGLRVRGEVTSPTFVIARVHPSTVGGAALAHVDAYRLGDEAELDDIDIDAFSDGSVTVVEWGEGIAEALSADRLRVQLSRAKGAEATDEARLITVTPVGGRWVGVSLRSALTAEPQPTP